MNLQAQSLEVKTAWVTEITRLLWKQAMRSRGTYLSYAMNPGTKLSSNICHHKRFSQLGVLIASYADVLGLVTRSYPGGTRDKP